MKFTSLHSVLLVKVFFLTLFSKESRTERSFIINYEKNSFYLDGKPFQYVSGSAHYFRMPNEYWRDRLRKIKAAGLNAVSTYVEWSQHEAVPGIFNFTGDLDIEKYIKIAQEEGLYVLLRPGPYICAERDMGGLPYWLMTKHPNIELRSSDSNYKEYVERWMNLLLEKLAPHLYGRGGPIIMVQVENEYGSYYSCDFSYLNWLRDLFKRHVKDDAVLFTTDGASSNFLKCGKIEGVYATVDFGSNYNVTEAFKAQRKFEPRGPYVNSEFYPGWLTHWGDKSMAKAKTKDVVKTLKEMLDKKANVNFYMFYGGTNFGFTAGANLMPDYKSDITSYDYDAPISEAGDITEKYNAIKEVLHEYFPPECNISVTSSKKGDYGEMKLKRAATIFSTKIREKMGKFSQDSQPQSFEALNQNFGYLLYETFLPQNEVADESQHYLQIEKVHDLAHIYVDRNLVGNMSREEKTNTVKIPYGKTVSILVENLGRVNFGNHINDKKGILSPVKLEKKNLMWWNMTTFEMKDVKAVQECFFLSENSVNNECDNGQGFVFYAKKFKLPQNEVPTETELDSFLDVSNLTKGLVFINDFNLGRYWSDKGPQYSLYVPGVYLKAYPEENTIIVMDEKIQTNEIKIKFSKTPILA